MNPAPDHALVLLAHGSRTSAESGLHVRRLAAELAEHAAAAEVRCAFWKEQPSLREALATVASDLVVLVPVFAATGWFTRHVVPRELGLRPDAPVQRRGRQRLVLVDPVGAHPAIAGLVRARLEQARSRAALRDVPARDIALVVAGHGTPRNPHSAATVRAHVARIEATGLLGAVHAAFLDQSPTLREVVATLPPALEHVVVVPCMISDGPHTRHDLPAALGLPDHLDDDVTSARVDGRTLHYTSAVGTHPRFASTVVGDALAAGLELANQDHDALPEATPDPWHDALAGGHVRRARQALFDALSRHPHLELAGLRISTTARGWRLSARDEVDRERVGLDSLVPLVDRITFDEAGRYRALRTRADLPGGWHLETDAPARLLDALEIVAPAAVALADWPGVEPLPVTPWAACAARHTGLLAAMGQRTDDEVATLVAQTCSTCTRAPAWHADVARRAVRCPEPCPIVRAQGSKPP